MLAISAEDIQLRIERDNPWWKDGGTGILEANHPTRVYFNPFVSLSLNFEVRRATILLGPRRVGKTFMMKQFVKHAIGQGVNPKCILYASIDTPIYSGIDLEKFLRFMPELVDQSAQKIVIYDEIQYLKGWETHLKDLVDSYPNIKFIASGSAAAALRLKSKESGAGRFSEFMLPPLTFFEFLQFINKDELVQSTTLGDCSTNNIEQLNAEFINYLNYGGYPEAVLNEEIRNNPEQFIKNDIIDKILLKDLPSLYGIQEIQELNKLFSFLAYNAGEEASLENISRESGITKPTIKKYMEYLESAFLIIKVSTVDDNCKSMKRERNFKIYLNNPSMRAALFAPVSPSDNSRIGHLTESAIFSQWQHSSGFHHLKYARWRNEGEVDIVYLGGPKQQPLWAGEIKWSDKVGRDPFEQTKALRYLIGKHSSIGNAFFTSRTVNRHIKLLGRPVHIVPSALYCFMVGKNITSPLDMPQIVSAKDNEDISDTESTQATTSDE